MNDTILILAPPSDIHARAVAEVLRREFAVPTVVWDTGRFPADDSMSFAITGSCARLQIRSADQPAILLESLRSIWWRRPGKFRVLDSMSHPKVREFCLNECGAFFRGALDAAGVPVINDPVAEAAAARKPLQLAVARGIGLTTPRTLMSNDPDAVVSFCREVDGPCIYKAFTPPDWQIAETRLLDEDGLRGLAALAHAPIIVQEKIEKGIDVRVNVFGDAVFAASVSTSSPAAELDWRMDLRANWRPHELPATIAASLLRLQRTLGLQYGCIDMRQRPDGTYVFLEVNPAGQFIFVEVDTGQPLVRTFAELLLRQDLGGAKVRPWNQR